MVLQMISNEYRSEESLVTIKNRVIGHLKKTRGCRESFLVDFSALAIAILNDSLLLLLLVLYTTHVVCVCKGQIGKWTARDSSKPGATLASNDSRLDRLYGA